MVRRRVEQLDGDEERHRLHVPRGQPLVAQTLDLTAQRHPRCERLGVHDPHGDALGAGAAQLLAQLAAAAQRGRPGLRLQHRLLTEREPSEAVELAE